MKKDENDGFPTGWYDETGTLRTLRISGEVRDGGKVVKPVSLIYEFHDAIFPSTLKGLIESLCLDEGKKLMITDMRVSDNDDVKRESKSLWGDGGDSDDVRYLSECTKAEVLPLDSGDTDIACRISCLLDGFEEENVELYDGEAKKLMGLLEERYGKVPGERGFYRNGEGKVVKRTDDGVFIDLDTFGPVGIEEIRGSSPWTRIHFVDEDVSDKMVD